MYHMLARDESAPQAPWLLLLHRLPPEPAYLRVKVRRRLQKVGAALVKNSVYVLPNTDEAMEDFQWVSREITAEGGDAMVCEATFVSGVTNQELQDQFERTQSDAPADATEARSYHQRTWVTRKNVFVDRIASAWLIRRFIDPGATFKFSAARDYAPASGELRFDMFEGEFTHEGDRCTFEVLAAKFLPRDKTLAAIGELIHDIDCKEEKFGRAETSAFHEQMKAIRRDLDDDLVRIDRGSAILDDLYARFRGSRS